MLLSTSSVVCSTRWRCRPSASPLLADADGRSAFVDFCLSQSAPPAPPGRQ